MGRLGGEGLEGLGRLGSEGLEGLGRLGGEGMEGLNPAQILKVNPSVCGGTPGIKRGNDEEVVLQRPKGVVP